MEPMLQGDASNEHWKAHAVPAGECDFGQKRNLSDLKFEMDHRTTFSVARRGPHCALIHKGRFNLDPPLRGPLFGGYPESEVRDPLNQDRFQIHAKKRRSSRPGVDLCPNGWDFASRKLNPFPPSNQGEVRRNGGTAVATLDDHGEGTPETV